MQGITGLFHPWGKEKFLPAGIWYLQDAACTNFATEKVSVARFDRKRQA